MNSKELNLIRDKLNSAISMGKGIDNKLHLMDDVESLITTIQKQQKEILQLKSEVQGWKSQVLTAKGWFDK